MKRIVVFLLLILILLGCTAKDSAPVNAGTESRQPETAPVGEAVDEVFAAVVTLAPATPDLLPTLPPTPTPTPSPEPTPTPDPTPTPEPTKDPNRPMVALTFDDGPNLTLTVPVLEKLEQYHVKATFFVLASAINDKNGYMLQMMVDGGHEIGVHGWNHDKMTQFSSSKNAERLEKTCKEISGWVEGGYQPRTMRPPGGSTNGHVKNGAKKAGLAVIKWSVDTYDWKTQNAKKIMEVVKKETKNGSIILCHDHHKPTLDVLDEMIPWLLEQGYDLVTVSELLESTGQPLEPGKVYFSKEIDN